MGRPKIDIDPIEVEKLAALGATVDEMSDFFDCAPSVLHARFQRNMDKGRTNLKMSLRQMQLKAAQNGNVAMMIWLGKQLLHQVDRSVIDIAKIPDEVFIEEAKRRLSSSGSEEPRDAKTISGESKEDP